MEVQQQEAHKRSSVQLEKIQGEIVSAEFPEGTDGCTSNIFPRLVRDLCRVASYLLPEFTILSREAAISQK